MATFQMTSKGLLRFELPAKGYIFRHVRRAREQQRVMLLENAVIAVVLWLVLAAVVAWRLG